MPSKTCRYCHHRQTYRDGELTFCGCGAVLHVEYTPASARLLATVPRMTRPDDDDRPDDEPDPSDNRVDLPYSEWPWWMP